MKYNSISFFIAHNNVCSMKFTLDLSKMDFALNVTFVFQRSQVYEQSDLKDD